ncbi:MAG: type II secretion system F family protein [Dehalococcoidia bacterium]
MTDALLLQWGIAGAAGVATALTVAGVAQFSRATQRRVRGRLEALQDNSTYSSAAPASVDLLRDRSSKIPLPGWLTTGQSGDRIQRMLEQAGLDLRVGEYLALRVICALVGLGAALSAWRLAGLDAVTFSLVTVVGVVFGTALPPMFIRRRINRRRRAIERELVEMCDLMASMLQSGFGYLQALNAVSEQVEQPLAGELTRMRDQIRLGAGVDDALVQLNERLNSADFDMVATAILIQRTSGGSLAPILSGVAKTIRDRHLFRAEVAALTSRERYSAIVLAGFPLLLTALLNLMLPETFGRLFTDPTGRLILAVALVADGTGYFLIKRATRLEV